MRGSTRGRSSAHYGQVRHSFSILCCVATMLALTACGGGGGGYGGDGGGGQQNTAPTVSAGADHTIKFPTNSVTLSGSATDAQGGTLTYAWTASPAGVTFANAAAASTAATFAAAGTYTLTLTVSDGAMSGADTVSVVVQAADNVAPVVSAGADQTLELPSSGITVTGSATDDGLPANTLTYAWTATPDGVTFANAAAASTTATFAAAGTYTLTLTVNDSALSGTDALIVTANPAVYPAADTDDTVPDRGWTRIAPADAGMDPALLQQAQQFAETTAGGAGLISRRGRLVHSWGDIDDRFASQSATKSIGGIALGFAIDDGLVLLSDRASTYLPTIGIDPDPPPNNDPAQLATITLLQLATHTAGFDKEGGYEALLFAPGTTWRYSDGGLNWLADTLTTRFGVDLDGVLNTRLWTILGLSSGVLGDDIRWRSMAGGQRPNPRPNGIEHREFGSGMSINANAMARFGLLFLRNGVWAGNRIVSEAFVNTVRTPPPEVASATIVEPENFPGATTNYGVLWWTNAGGLLPNVPTDAYWAWGQYESLIVVIPSLDLVIARIGPSHSFVDGGRVFGEQGWNADYAVLAPFLNPIVQSVTR
jgi:CubicO group peptidase (beta-lactamase class C family)